MLYLFYRWNVSYILYQDAQNEYMMYQYTVYYVFCLILYVGIEFLMCPDKILENT